MSSKAITGGQGSGNHEHHDTPVNPRICGPDATDFIANYLMAVISMGSSLRAGIACRPGSAIDMKEGRYHTSECPKAEECKESVTMCGVCVSNQLPGNISFGAAVSLWAVPVGSYFSWTGESGEDRNAYAIGWTLRDHVERGFVDRGDIKDLKKRLCAMIRHYLLDFGVPKADKGKDGLEWHGCDPCTASAVSPKLREPYLNCSDALAGMPSGGIRLEEHLDPWLELMANKAGSQVR
jgi:hypothetical protein